MSAEEKIIIDDLTTYFTESVRLRKHLDFLYQKGSLYLCHNGNLLFHGCVPMTADGNFSEIIFEGRKFAGKSYLDYVDERIRKAYVNRKPQDLDFMAQVNFAHCRTGI